MPLLQYLRIDNSLDSAVKTGSSRKPTAEFYKKLMKRVGWKELLSEAYLVAPVETIQNDEDGITPYLNCGCYFPHHVIQNDKLVLSVPGLKRAFLEAVTQRKYHGEIKRHLERHMEDLERIIDFNAVFTSDFDGIQEYIASRLKSMCSRASESYITEVSCILFEGVKQERARIDAEAWVNGNLPLVSGNLVLAESVMIRFFSNGMFRHKELRLTEEEATSIFNTLKEDCCYGAAHSFMDGWKSYNKQ